MVALLRLKKSGGETYFTPCRNAKSDWEKPKAGYLHRQPAQ